VTELADACAELREALPLAEALITAPDADGTAGRCQPSSRPPWNQAAAAALLDAVDGARRLEATWRSDAAGRMVVVRPASAMGSVLASLQRLAERVPQASRDEAATWLFGRVTVIKQLPAVDQAERPQEVVAPCPYCGYTMMRLYPRSGRVTCLRFGACADADGAHPVGHVTRNRLSGDAEVAWNDGLVT
jgi:hypothetical protein